MPICTGSHLDRIQRQINTVFKISVSEVVIHIPNRTVDSIINDALNGAASRSTHRSLSESKPRIVGFQRRRTAVEERELVRIVAPQIVEHVLDVVGTGLIATRHSAIPSRTSNSS